MMISPLLIYFNKQVRKNQWVGPPAVQDATQGKL
jgi:hypothetical protein